MGDSKTFVRFKQLQFSSPDKFNVNRLTKVEAFIPGVNSGMYQKQMCLKVSIKEKGVFRVNQLHGEVVLNVSEITELRDECNKILALNNT